MVRSNTALVPKTGTYAGRSKHILLRNQNRKALNSSAANQIKKLDENRCHIGVLRTGTECSTKRSWGNLKLTTLVAALVESVEEMRQSNEIMKGDEELVNDHRYYCRNGNYLTPPQTPRSEGESSATTMRSTPAILPKDFNHYYTYADFYDNEDEERFFDFAEDFQDLRLPMLKQDCMWGTAAQINHESSCEKAADDAKNQEVDSIRHRTHFVATPSILDARMTCLTPCNFIERSSSIFAPISNEHSTNDINSKGRDVNHICIRDKASDYLNDSALLLSPNETESGELNV